jgi:glycosyltransferase involved in cell wall biosynthesis
VRRLEAPPVLRYTSRVRKRSFLFASLMNGTTWGGSEELWYRTALELAREGHEVGCAMYGWPDRRPRLDALRAAGARVYELPNAGHHKRNLLETGIFELSTRLRRRVALAAVPFERYDCTILNQGGWQDLAAAEWTSVRRRLNRYVILSHNYEDELRISPRRAKRLTAWIEGAVANLFAAEPIRIKIEEKFGLSLTNAGVLLNPIAFPAPERPAPLPPGPPWRFAVLAALDVRRKAQDALLEALSGPRWADRDFELSLFGTGPDEALLADSIRERGLTGKVRLRGHVSDVQGVLRDTHVLLHMTRMDAMPIAVVEAMAMGRPAAVSRLGDMPAWIRPGESGWVAPAATTEVIAATLEEVWASRAEWAALGERAHRVFRARSPIPGERRLVADLLALAEGEAVTAPAMSLAR